MSPTKLHTPRRLLVALGVAVPLAVAVAACASSPPAADAGKTLTVGSNVAPTTPGQPDMSPGTTAPRNATEAEDELTKAERDLEKLVGAEPAPTPLSTDACATVCKALASIRNAAEHVCALSTDDPSRCESARKRAERAEERAKSACPSCRETD